MGEFAGLDIINAKLERMLAVGGLDRQAYMEIGHMLRGEIIENFSRGGRPTPWPLSGRVKAFGGNTLRDHSYLLHSFSVQPTDDGVAIGSTGENKAGVSFGMIARVHAEGRVIRAKNAPFLAFGVPLGLRTTAASGKALKTPEKNFGFVRVKQVTIPQRDFRYISPHGVSVVVTAAGRRLIVGGQF